MNKPKALTKSFILCCGILIFSLTSFFMIGCSQSSDGFFVREADNRFTVINGTDRFLCEGSHGVRLVYDRETFMVYYYTNSEYNYNICPYLINGHFAKYDLKSNSIVELKSAS